MSVTDLTAALPSSGAREPHLAWPPRLAADGSVAVVEGDSPAHVAQRAALTLTVQPGDLVDNPELGVPRSALLGGDEDRVRAALRRSDPRLEASVTTGDLVDLVRSVTVSLEPKNA